MKVGEADFKSAKSLLAMIRGYTPSTYRPLIFFCAYLLGCGMCYHQKYKN
jgi:hypothetical protein